MNSSATYSSTTETGTSVFQMFVTISDVTSENGTNVTTLAPSADCELFPDDPHYCVSDEDNTYVY